MKKIIILFLSLILILSVFSACTKSAQEIVVGATSTPHGEVLEHIKPEYEALGYKLKIVIYDDYVLPNIALEDGTLNANYFQHVPYMESFNASKGTHIVSAGAIHYEPLGFYSNVEDLHGATVCIPNDGSNETRALFLLQENGYLKLKEGVTADSNLTVEAIAENTYNLDIVEMDASLIPARFKNGGIAAVINGNYAIAADINIKDAIAVEAATGPAAALYANIISVKSGNEGQKAIKDLVSILQSESTQKWINENYNGAVLGVK